MVSNMDKTMTTISLFTGAGGLDWGFHELGFKNVVALDKKSDAATTFHKNFGALIFRGPLLLREHYSVCDILDSVVGESFPTPSVLIGGPPCQDFSVIRELGKREGTKTLRGKLYLHFARYLATLKPLSFVFENVPGLLSSNKGEDIRAIMEDFSDLKRLPERWLRQHREEPSKTPPPPEDLLEEHRRGGIPSYRIVFSGIVDASWHGVPQRRRRLIIIGLRKDLEVEEGHVMAIREALGGSPALRKYPLTPLEAFEGATLPEITSVYREIVREWGGLFPGGDAIEDYFRLHKGNPKDPLFDQAMEEHEALIGFLGWKGRSLSQMPPEFFPDGSHVLPKEKPSIISRMHRIPPGGNYATVRGKGISTIYRRLHPLLPSYTVLAHGGGGTWGYHYQRSRSKLTNRERARLQSFPDSFQFCGGVSKVRSQIGEAVPPLLSLSIARVMRVVLEDVWVA